MYLSIQTFLVGGESTYSRNIITQSMPTGADRENVKQAMSKVSVTPHEHATAQDIKAENCFTKQVFEW